MQNASAGMGAILHFTFSVWWWTRHSRSQQWCTNGAMSYLVEGLNSTHCVKAHICLSMRWGYIFSLGQAADPCLVWIAVDGAGDRLVWLLMRGSPCWSSKGDALKASFAKGKRFPKCTRVKVFCVFTCLRGNSLLYTTWIQTSKTITAVRLLARPCYHLIGGWRTGLASASQSDSCHRYFKTWPQNVNGSSVS